MAEQTHIFGIHLGATNSSIAFVDEFGNPVVIPNAEGFRNTPSVIYFDGSNRVVGNEAKNNSHLYPDQVVQLVQRQMGQPDWFFRYEGIEYSGAEITSYILKKLVQDAEAYLGHSITDVVITCPNYFDINGREALAKAGEIANLNVRSIINESTAAAIGYAVHQDKDQVVLVYHLGGSLFDISLLDIRDKEMNIIAVGGDHFLGGRNWDEIIVNYLAEEWKTLSRSQSEPLDDPETSQDLFLKAEQAKISLSARERTNIGVTHARERQKITLTREKFNELTASLLERTIEYTRQLLEEATKKGYVHIDQILLVGGATRMPQVAARLEKEIGLKPLIFDPDEVIVKGAALFGQKIVTTERVKIKVESWEIDRLDKPTATAEPPNIFILLDLDPRSPWDTNEFERKLQEKRREWSRLVNMPTEKGFRSRKYLGSITKIIEIASLEEERNKQAIVAVRQREEVRAKKLQEFQERLSLIQLKGYIFEEEIDFLGNEYKNLIAASKIRDFIKVPIRKSLSISKLRKASLAPVKFKQIQTKMRLIEKTDLYHFLGETHETSTEKLLELAKIHYGQMIKKAYKSPTDTIITEVCGYCFIIFGSETEKAKYDESLRLQQYDDLKEKIDRLAEVSKQIEAKQMNYLLGEAKEKKLDLDEARMIILEYAAKRGYVIIVSSEEIHETNGFRDLLITDSSIREDIQSIQRYAAESVHARE